MNTGDRYENYPIWIVLLSGLVSLAIYGFGFLIMLRLGWILSVLYLVYVLILEYRLIRYHCTRCLYWGKICGFGKGRLSSWFFKKDENRPFCAMEISWKTMIPDLMVSLVPFGIGVVLIVLKFDWVLMAELLILLVLTTMGNGFIRGTLTCRYCRQQEAGCPADKLFNKEK